MDQAPVKRTIAFSDDESVFKAFKAQLAGPVGLYDRVEMPSYIAEQGNIGMMDSRRLNQMLTKAGVAQGELSEEQQKAVFRAMRGDLGDNVTLVGIPEEVAKKLKKTGQFRNVQMVDFNGANGSELIKQFKKDGVLQKGDYLDRFGAKVEDMANRKTPLGNEQDFAGGIMETRMERFMPDPPGDAPGVEDLRYDMGQAVIGVGRNLGDRDTQKSLMKGTVNPEAYVRQLGHGQTIDTLKGLKHAQEMEQRRQAQLEAQRQRQEHIRQNSPQRPAPPRPGQQAAPLQVEQLEEVPEVPTRRRRGMKGKGDIGGMG